MSDVRSIVNRIRSRLNHGRCEYSDEFVALHDEYVKACREVNERLLRCEERLAAGRRSEAIHLADADPPVLDAVAALDFAERDEWSDIALMYDLDAVELIRVDIAEQLEDEYLVNDSLEELMVEHRLLALKRAPLGRRLKVLRKIHEQDPQPHWEDDIRSWETRRLAEIEDEARMAYQAGNTTALVSLDQEMSSQNWLVTSSDAVAKKVRKAAKAVGSSTAKEKLQSMVEPIAEAYASSDVERTRILRGKWDSLAKQAELSANDDLYRAPATAFAWLDGIDQQAAREAEYARSVAALENLLETDADLAQLKETANDLVRQGFDPPTELAERYRRKVAEDERRQGRRRVLLLGVAAVVLAAVASVSYFLFDQARFTRELNEFVVETEELIDSGLLEDADGLMRQKLEFRATDQYAAVESSLRDAVAADAAARKDFAGFIGQMAAVESRPDLQKLYEQAAGVAFPSTHPSFAEQQKQLEATRKSTAARLDQWAEEARSQFDSQLAAATNDVKEAEGLIFEDAEGFDVTYAAASKSLASLKPLAAKLDPRDLTVRQNQISALQTRLTKASDERKRIDKWNKSVSQLVAAAKIKSTFGPDSSRINPLIGQLNEFSNNFNDEAATLCATSASEAERWRSAIQWQELVAQWKNDPLPVVDSEARVSKVDEFIQSHPNCPGLARIEDYATLVDTVRARRGSRNPVETIRTYLSNSAISSAYVFETEDGRRFYAPKSEAKARELTASFELYRDFKRGVERAGVNATQYRDFTGPGQLAPQSRIASEALASFKSIDSAGWIKTFKEVTLRIARDADVDPILKLNLLQLCLTNAGRGHATLASSLEPATSHIESYQWDMFADWLFPGFDDESDATSENRQKAERVLAELPALAPLFDNATDETKRLLADVFRERLPVALVVPSLDRENDSEPVRTTWEASRPHELAVVTVNGDKSAWTVIGQCSGSQTTLTTRDKSILQPGRLVFASPHESPVSLRSAAGPASDRKVAAE